MKPNLWHERTVLGVLAATAAAAVALLIPDAALAAGELETVFGWIDDEAIAVFADGYWDEGLAMVGAATGVGVMKRHDIGSGLMIAAGSVAGWGIINSIAA
jgi:hypothetical protein